MNRTTLDYDEWIILESCLFGVKHLLQPLANEWVDLVIKENSYLNNDRTILLTALEGITEKVSNYFSTYAIENEMPEDESVYAEFKTNIQILYSLLTAAGHLLGVGSRETDSCARGAVIQTNRICQLL